MKATKLPMVMLPEDSFLTMYQYKTMENTDFITVASASWMETSRFKRIISYCCLA